MPTSDPLDEYIDAAANALGIAIIPEWKAEVRSQLQVTLRLGAQVTAFPLPDDAEPAPAFEA